MDRPPGKVGSRPRVPWPGLDAPERRKSPGRCSAVAAQPPRRPQIRRQRNMRMGCLTSEIIQHGRHVVAVAQVAAMSADRIEGQARAEGRGQKVEIVGGQDGIVGVGHDGHVPGLAQERRDPLQAARGHDFIGSRLGSRKRR